MGGRAGGGGSRAALVARQRVEAEAAEKQPPLTIHIQKARIIANNDNANAHNTTNADTSEDGNVLSLPSGGRSRPGSSSASTRSNTQQSTSPTPTTPNSSTPSPSPALLSNQTFVSFRHLDAASTLFESLPTAASSGCEAVYDLQATAPLTVNEALLDRIHSQPVVIEVWQQTDEGDDANANVTTGDAAPPEAAEDATTAKSGRRGATLLGQCMLPLTSLLQSDTTSFEGWYPVRLYSSSPSPNYFAPDPDLAQPDVFVPLAWHQCNHPLVPPPTADAKGMTSARASAPNTPDVGSRRLASRDGKKEAKAAEAAAASAAAATLQAEAEASAAREAAAATQLNMDLFISVRLARPLLSESDRASAFTLELSVDRLSSLPKSWLSEASELDAEKDRARTEAENAIAAWRKKGAKRATLGKAGAAAGKNDADKKKAAASSAAGGGSSDKKNEKARAREMELKALGDRLNSMYRYGFSLQIPLSNDASAQMSNTTTTLSMPPPSPPSSPMLPSASASTSTLAVSPDVSRPTSAAGGSASNSARRPSFSASGRDGGAGAGAGGAGKGMSKSNKKAEEERLAKELAEQQEIAAVKLNQRLAARFIPFGSSRSIFFTGDGAAYLRSLIEQGTTFNIQLYRELVAVDPALPVPSFPISSNPTVISRDVLSGVATLDLKPFLKAGATTLTSELSVRLDPEAEAALEKERLAALAAMEAAAGEEALADEKNASQKMSGGTKKSGRRESMISSSSSSHAPHASITSTSSLLTQPPADPYTAAHTILSLRARSNRPLVPVVVKPVLSLGQVIPPRRLELPPRPSPAVELSEEIRAFVTKLAVEYDKMDEEMKTAETNNAAQHIQAEHERNQALAESLIYHLNATGQYHAFRERLKPVLQKLHRKGCKNETTSGEFLTHDQRLSRLYAQTIDRMHLTLNDLFNPPLHSPPPSLNPTPKLPTPLLLTPDTPYSSFSPPADSLGCELRSEQRIKTQVRVASEGMDHVEAGARLGVLAQEAELQGDYVRAAALYQQRCLLEYEERYQVPAAVTAKYWFDFACFQLRLHHFRAASNALRHAISIHPTHAPSILALAALTLEQRDVDTCEVLLRSFRQIQPQLHQQADSDLTLPLQCLVLEALYAEDIDEKEQADSAWMEAERACGGAATTSVTRGGNTSRTQETIVQTNESAQVLTLSLDPTSNSTGSTESDSAPHLPGTARVPLITLPPGFKHSSSSAASQSAVSSECNAVWLRASRYLLGLGLVELASRVLRREKKDSPMRSLQLARVAQVRLGVAPLTFSSSSSPRTALLQECLTHLSSAVLAAVDAGQVIEAHSMRGHLSWQQGELDAAIQDYETFQDWEPSVCDPLLLYRLGVYYFNQTRWEEARQIFLQLSAVAPSAVSWLRTGMSCMEIQAEAEQSGSSSDEAVANAAADAEAALIQANRMDKSHPDVWARLAIVSLRRQRYELAHHALLHALNLSCRDGSLLSRIGGLYLRAGYVDLAASTLERALQLEELPAPLDARIDLVDAYMAQQRYEEAEIILNKMEESMEPDDALIGPVRIRLIRLREAEAPGSMAPHKSIEPSIQTSIEPSMQTVTF